MEQIKLNLSNFQIKKGNEEYLKNKELADQVYQFLGKQLSFPRILVMIKNYGYQYIFECFNEIKRAKCDNYVALFIYKVGQVKIKYQ